MSQKLINLVQLHLRNMNMGIQDLEVKVPQTWKINQLNSLISIVHQDLQQFAKQNKISYILAGKELAQDQSLNELIENKPENSIQNSPLVIYMKIEIEAKAHSELMQEVLDIKKQQFFQKCLKMLAQRSSDNISTIFPVLNPAFKKDVLKKYEREKQEKMEMEKSKLKSDILEEKENQDEDSLTEEEQMEGDRGFFHLKQIIQILIFSGILQNYLNWKYFLVVVIVQLIYYRIKTNEFNYNIEIKRKQNQLEQMKKKKSLLLNIQKENEEKTQKSEILKQSEKQEEDLQYKNENYKLKELNKENNKLSDIQTGNDVFSKNQNQELKNSEIHSYEDIFVQKIQNNVLIEQEQINNQQNDNESEEEEEEGKSSSPNKNFTQMNNSFKQNITEINLGKQINLSQKQQQKVNNSEKEEDINDQDIDKILDYFQSQIEGREIGDNKKDFQFYMHMLWDFVYTFIVSLFPSWKVEVHLKKQEERDQLNEQQQQEELEEGEQQANEIQGAENQEKQKGNNILNKLKLKTVKQLDGSMSASKDAQDQQSEDNEQFLVMVNSLLKKKSSKLENQNEDSNEDIFDRSQTQQETLNQKNEQCLYE